MKKFCLIVVSLSVFSAADAQSAGRTSPAKIQKSLLPVIAVPVEKRLINIDPRTSKRPLIISTEPAPKADPAREAFAQRKQRPVKMENPKTN